MKQSTRARRIQRHQRRSQQKPTLNLVSLMDIFTILVFFLMVNSSEVKVLQQDNSISLPKSIANNELRETLVVKVSNEDLIVQGKVVAQYTDNPEQQTITGLFDELSYQANRQVINEQDFAGYAVTIMADKELPYRVLKRILATCAEAEFTQISLAVSKIATALPKGEG